MNLDLYLIPYIKVNFRWVIDLNGKSKVIKYIEEEEASKKRRDFALVMLSLQYSKDRHVGRIHAQLQMLVMCLRVKVGLEMEDL